jgi:peptidoglycan hydrolase CwlO-like protein
VNGYLKRLQREYQSLQTELLSCQEKIKLYQEEIPRLEKKMEELAEIIAVVSQLPRYQKENNSLNSVPQKDGAENAKNSVD